MSYTCPQCNVGQLKPARSTYVRWWFSSMVTAPNFAAWRCDCCGYTRYDGAALARVNLLFGPDEDAGVNSVVRRQQAEGPGVQGPRRWTP